MIIDLMLLAMAAVCAVAAVRIRDLLSAIMILTMYSLLMALIWTRLNALDVAFTEAAVGAGISTVLLLAALSRTTRGEEAKPKTRTSLRFSPKVSLMVVLLTGALLAYATLDMPNFADPNAPPNLHIAPYYIEHSAEETGSDNFVAAVLASYRGYDTLGEVTVIFTAGTGVILLLRRSARQGKGEIDRG